VTRVTGLGVLTGWGIGPGALPVDARAAARGRRVIALGRPPLDGERFRRATRECLLGVAAVEAMLTDAGLSAGAVGGSDTALVYATAAAYGASNRAFVVAGAASSAPPEGGPSHKDRGSVYFPYTAPSAVPAEVAIEYGLRGGYVILVGGPTAGVEALWQAATLLAAGRCKRALVLAVETFAECEELWGRGRWLVRQPLVESATCALLEGDGDVGYAVEAVPAPLERLTRRRAGETLACEPLIGLSLAREAGELEARVTGHWRGRRMGVTLALSTTTRVTTHA
jgi:3-oxoacyl-[acyl-carrier-protein] synthase II